MSRVIRQYDPKDREACRAIYHANLEAGLIPDRYEDDFLADLESTESLTLVMVVDGELLGCGSVGCFWDGSTFCANLSYGLIHPDHHRKKLGSYLLVSRLSLLDENHGQCVVCLSAVKGSVEFYAGVVGFTEYDQTWDAFGNQFSELSMNVGPRRLQDARDYMAASGIEMEPALNVPVSFQVTTREMRWD